MKTNSPPDVEPRRPAVSRSRGRRSPRGARRRGPPSTSAPQHVDVRPRRDLLDQVVRHALLERVAAAQIVTLRAWLAKYSAAWPAEFRRRSGGRRARACRAPRCARHRSRCPCRPAGRSPRSSSRRQDTPQARMIVRARRTSPPSRCTWRVAGSIRVIDAGDEDLGAEPARLLQRAARELVARDARREAQVVLDPRRRPGLAARRLALDDDRPQPLRRAVDGRREPGRSAADDHRVVLAAAGSVVSPSNSATRRSCGRTTVCRRRRGRGQSLILRQRPVPLLGRVGRVRAGAIGT